MATPKHSGATEAANPSISSPPSPGVRDCIGMLTRFEVEDISRDIGHASALLDWCEGARHFISTLCFLADHSPTLADVLKKNDIRYGPEWTEGESDALRGLARNIERNAGRLMALAFPSEANHG